MDAKIAIKVEKTTVHRVGQSIVATSHIMDAYFGPDNFQMDFPPIYRYARHSAACCLPNDKQFA